MKRILFLACLIVSAGVSAMDLSFLRHNREWKKIAENEYAINFDGSRTWPALELKSPVLKPNAFYLLEFDGRSSNSSVHTQVAFRDTRHGKPCVSYVRWRGGEKYSRIALYFRTFDAGNGRFTLYINPGVSAQVAVRNFSLREISSLSRNLLVHGDFESGNDFLPHVVSSPEEFSVTDSPTFLCGERSLRLRKKSHEETKIVSGDLPLIPGRTADIRFWVRSARNTVSVQLMLDCGRPGQNRHLYKLYKFKAEPDWTQICFQYRIPEDSNTYTALQDHLCKLRFALLRSPETAEVYFDNIEFRIL